MPQSKIAMEKEMAAIAPARDVFLPSFLALMEFGRQKTRILPEGLHHRATFVRNRDCTETIWWFQLYSTSKTNVDSES
jgi:hypothetical protein